MAATRNCDACSDLQENSADFVQNGVTDAVCNSLKNNTGFNTSSENDNCTDLNNANDCLIGNMEDEIDSYDMCDWKEYMRNFVHNLWNVLKAMICSMCGLWTNVEKHECELQHVYDGNALEVGEEGDDESYIKVGGGVSCKYDAPVSGGRTSDVSVLYIAGGLLRVQGTFRFFANDFVDKDGRQRSGNSHWGETGACVGGGELICEAYIKKSQYGVRSIYAGFGQETGGGHYSLNATVFNDHDSDGNRVYAYGQHGSCNTITGVGNNGNSDGHLVPIGYCVIQLRMSYIGVLNASGASDPANATHYSPRAFMGIRFNRNQIEC